MPRTDRRDTVPLPRLTPRPVRTLGLDAAARRARPVTLDPGMTDARAWVVVATECTDQWHANEADLLHSRAAPHLHQMRVGIRRLRSSASLFRPLLRDVPGAVATAHRLRALALPFGAARDLDVLLGGPLAEALPRRARDELWSAREAAHDEVARVLTSDGWREVGAAVDDVVGRVAALPDTGRDDVTDLARAALDKRWRRVVGERYRLRSMTPLERHAVRIEAKKLRYGSEFFATLFPTDRPRRTSSGGELVGGLAYAHVVAEVQDALGALNDHATADELLRSVGGGAPAVDEPALVEAGAQSVDRLAAVPPFWH